MSSRPTSRPSRSPSAPRRTASAAARISFSKRVTSACAAATSRCRWSSTTPRWRSTPSSWNTNLAMSRPALQVLLRLLDPPGQLDQLPPRLLQRTRRCRLLPEVPHDPRPGLHGQVELEIRAGHVRADVHQVLDVLVYGR